MSNAIAVAPPLVPVQTTTDEAMLELWLHGKAVRIRRAYTAEPAPSLSTPQI